MHYASTQSCRNVMQDVTRLLYLLNKKPSAVEMPADGLQLLKWSQQILERYLTSQVNTQTKNTNIPTSVTQRVPSIKQHAKVGCRMVLPSCHISLCTKLYSDTSE